jgi:hypothetical protein
MYAKIAAIYITAYCRETFAAKMNPEDMGSHVANGIMMDVFDHLGYGTHKYIPADRLTEDLGEKKGAGVFSYWKLRDGSYLLRTCRGRLAYWSGKVEDKAEWAPDPRNPKV